MRTRRLLRRSLLIATVAAACGARSTGGEADDGAGSAKPVLPLSQAMPHPAPQGRSGDAAARNAECESCHLEVADEWRSSLHAEAFTGREFSHAFRLEPLPFCRGCHAPEAGPRPDVEAEALGVACVTCHLVDDDVVLAGPRALAGSSEDPPHPLRREARFATPEACAGCHEFEFPGARREPEFMQTTVTEHRRSSQSERSCADCHMPARADGGRSHTFLGSRDEAWMRSVVSVEARRTGPDEVVLTLDLDSDAVGHALPTGDLFRRISVEAMSTRRALRPTTARRILARHWGPKKDAEGHSTMTRTELFDDRLGVGEMPRIVRLSLDPRDAALPVRWRVRYERVESMLLGPGDGGVVVGGVLLAEGTLPPFEPTSELSAVDDD